MQPGKLFVLERELQESGSRNAPVCNFIPATLGFEEDPVQIDERCPEGDQVVSGVRRAEVLRHVPDFFTDVKPSQAVLRQGNQVLVASEARKSATRIRQTLCTPWLKLRPKVRSLQDAALPRARGWQAHQQH